MLSLPWVKDKRDSQLTKHDRELQNLRADLVKAERAERTAKSKHDQECRDLRGQISATKTQCEQELRSLRGDLERSQASQRHLSEARDKAEEEKRQLSNDLAAKDQVFRREKTDLQLQHERKVQELRTELLAVDRQHESKVKELQLQLSRQIEASRGDALSTKNLHDGKVESLKQQNAQDSETRQARYRQLEQGIRDECKLETANLRQQVDELNSALLSHDDEVYSASLFSTSGLPQKTDANLTHSFSEIEALVADISRTAWSTNQTVWSDHALQKLSSQHGVRRVKRAILQDLVWYLLYQYVFASPFRIFGEPGKELEQEWARGSPKGASSNSSRYTWPSTSAQMERWRYMTLQKCREVLSQPIPSQWDPRAPLKKGYSDTVTELGAKIQATVQDIAPVDKQTIDSISKLSRKAAKVWLDFGMHRARIVVSMPGQEPMSFSQRIAKIQLGGVVLTTIPKLGRYGNNEGGDLDKFIVIRNGESLELS